jgi:hypothetical protein
VHVAAGVVALLHRAAVLDQGQGGGLEVGRAADQVGNLPGGPLDHLVGGLAGGHHPHLGPELRHLAVPALGKAALHDQRQLAPGVGVLRAVARRALVPLRLRLRAALGTRREVLGHLVGHEELGVGIPAIGLLGETYLLLAEG